MENNRSYEDKAREAISQMIEIELFSSEDFLKIKETLSRIGVTYGKKRRLFQSAHILHKQGRYYISHFKSLFLLDGNDSTFDEDDEARLNRIVSLLLEWNMFDLANTKQKLHPQCEMSELKVVKYGDKDNWEFIQKYNLGKIKNK